MTKFNDVSQFIPENLQEFELWPKIQELTQYILDNAVKELEDVRLKFSGPDVVSEDVVRAVIEEQGFNYIVEIMDTISNFEFNTLLSYVSLISQLKGSRDGIELVLRLLGFDSVIVEWWEVLNNPGEPLTYDITILADSSNVTDLFATVNKVQIFSRNYVLAQISNIDIQFILEDFAQKAPLMAGFITPTYTGVIIERAIP